MYTYVYIASVGTFSRLTVAVSLCGPQHDVDESLLCGVVRRVARCLPLTVSAAHCRLG